MADRFMQILVCAAVWAVALGLAVLVTLAAMSPNTYHQSFVAPVLGVTCCGAVLAGIALAPPRRKSR